MCMPIFYSNDEAFPTCGKSSPIFMQLEIYLIETNVLSSCLSIIYLSSKYLSKKT